jgi:hypothetical protein
VGAEGRQDLHGPLRHQPIRDANDQANGVTLKNPDGSVMVRPDSAVVTAIEDIAELIDNLSPQGNLLTRHARVRRRCSRRTR